MNTREKVIAALERERGSFISGEALAQSCGVSRNAIWKSISELKEEGYPIRSVQNRGYMLEESSDIISKAGICAYLKDADGDLSGRIHIYGELDSTSTEAKRRLLGTEAAHGMVIVAKRQTAGRGHFGSSFPSPDGGIYLSLLLEAEKMRDKLVPLTELASEAVRGVLERLFSIEITKGKDSSLYLGQEKVCGIMTEGVVDLETGEFGAYVVGIGIWLEKLSPPGRRHQKNEIIATLVRELDL